MVLHCVPEKSRVSANDNTDQPDEMDVGMAEGEDRDENGLNGPVEADLVRSCISAQERSALASLECDVRGPQMTQTSPEEEGT